MSTFEPEWEASYRRGENHVFVPSDELVRFVSRRLRRRLGLDEVVDVLPGAAGSRVLDLGCGIGRSLVFGTDMGLEMHGIDLSSVAVATAVEWLGRRIGDEARERVVVGDAAALPWAEGHFAHAVSDSALDSMPFDVARAAVAELARVVRPGGYVYLNLIAGDGEVVVTGTHEQGTVQSYYDEAKIDALLGDPFEVLERQLAELHDGPTAPVQGRWHLVLRRR